MHYTSTDDIENDLRARWNDAERCLIDKAKADVLTIMDCCYASDLPSEGARAEYLRPHRVQIPSPAVSSKQSMNWLKRAQTGMPVISIRMNSPNASQNSVSARPLSYGGVSRVAVDTLS
jgi:hypothetical protein